MGHCPILGTVKLSRICPFCGRILLDQRLRINDLAVAAGGENAAKLLNLTVPRRMRRKLRDPAGRAVYQRRKAIVEPVIGVLKEQRGMRQFRRRGLEKVAVEFALAATAFNLTRLWRNKPKLDQEG